VKIFTCCRIRKRWTMKRTMRSQAVHDVCDNELWRCFRMPPGLSTVTGRRKSPIWLTYSRVCTATISPTRLNLCAAHQTPRNTSRSRLLCNATLTLAEAESHCLLRPWKYETLTQPAAMCACPTQSITHVKKPLKKRWAAASLGCVCLIRSGRQWAGGMHERTDGKKLAKEACNAGVTSGPLSLCSDDENA
jgi:hypothetical protein